MRTEQKGRLQYSLATSVIEQIQVLLQQGGACGIIKTYVHLVKLVNFELAPKGLLSRVETPLRRIRTRCEAPLCREPM